MAHELTGRVWLLPDDIQAAQILPYAAFKEMDPEEVRAHLLEGVVPGIGARIGEGDILWAGDGFGQGSSREEVPRALRMLGVRLVLASSFARIFYRNAINIGLPVAVGDPGSTRDGDELRVNLVSGEVFNVTRERTIRVHPVPKEIRPVLAEGGLLDYVRKHDGLRGED